MNKNQEHFSCCWSWASRLSSPRKLTTYDLECEWHEFSAGYWCCSRCCCCCCSSLAFARPSSCDCDFLSGSSNLFVFFTLVKGHRAGGSSVSVVVVFFVFSFSLRSPVRWPWVKHATVLRQYLNTMPKEKREGCKLHRLKKSFLIFFLALVARFYSYDSYMVFRDCGGSIWN